ncbi:MAG TPA: hypothetical protein VFJ00_00735 [Candidatus Limnocylindria bacterium]|nr:hypothetical protein [Candidatus Limnocylindria bacterium]
MTTRKAVSRPTIFLVALAALTLSLYFAVRPVHAGEPATLNDNFIGTDSSQAEDSCQEGDDVPAGMVLWHFILNGLEPGITSAIAGQFEFEFDGTLNVDSTKWNPGGDTHHFYVYTTGDDVLEGASADIGDSAYNNFVLSHLCHGDETEQSVEESVAESVEESVAESVEESVAESGEQSVEAGTGTPEESVSDGALSLNGVGPLPTIAFSLILLASLGALAYANVKSVRS